MMDAIDYKPPTGINSLIALLDELPELDEPTQNAWVRRLVEDSKPVVAGVRRAAFVRMSLVHGVPKACELLGVSRTGLLKTRSEARGQLQEALKMTGTYEELTQIGAPFGPLCRAVRDSYERNLGSSDSSYDQVSHKLGLAYTLACYILRDPDPTQPRED